MGYVIVLVLVAAGVFIGIRFVAANNAQKAVTAINLGRNAGLKYLEPLFTEYENKTAKDRKGMLQRFFLTFAASQYTDCCKRNKLKPVPAERLAAWLDNEAGKLAGLSDSPASLDVRQHIDHAASSLADSIAGLSQEQMGEESCVFGLVEPAAAELAKLVFTQPLQDGKPFARELTVALSHCSKAVCEQVAGGAAGGRHFGGGCC